MVVNHIDFSALLGRGAVDISDMRRNIDKLKKQVSVELIIGSICIMERRWMENWFMFCGKCRSTIFITVTGKQYVSSSSISSHSIKIHETV